MTETNRDWRGQEWEAEEALWDEAHPLRKHLGAAARPEIVKTAYGSTAVIVPDIDDAALRQIIAYAAAAMDGRFLMAHREVIICAMELIARKYYDLDCDEEKWLAYLADIGVKIAGQSRNFFVSFFRLLCGSRRDRSNHLGKIAAALAEWAAVYDHQTDTLSPKIDGQPGTSGFAKWVSEEGGYTAISKKWTLRLQTAKRPMDASSRSEETDGQSPSASPGPAKPEPPAKIGDTRITGYAVTTIVRGDKPALAANDPAAKWWNVEWFVQVNRADAPDWFLVYVNHTSLTDVLADAAALRAFTPKIIPLLAKPIYGDRRVVGVWRPGNLHQGVAVPPDTQRLPLTWQAQRVGVSGHWLSLPVGGRDTDYASQAEAEAALEADRAAPATPPEPSKGTNPHKSQPRKKGRPAKLGDADAKPKENDDKKIDKKIAERRAEFDQYAYLDPVAEEDNDPLARWLHGDTDDAEEAEAFEAFDNLGVSNVAELYNILEDFSGETLGHALYALDTSGNGKIFGVGDVIVEHLNGYTSISQLVDDYRDASKQLEAATAAKEAAEQEAVTLRVRILELEALLPTAEIIPLKREGGAE